MTTLIERASRITTFQFCSTVAGIASVGAIYAWGMPAAHILGGVLCGYVMANVVREANQ